MSGSASSFLPSGKLPGSRAERAWVSWSESGYELHLDAKEYPTESAAQAAADALRLTINNHSQRNSLRRTTVNTLWEHYRSEELPLKEVSTQDVYVRYVKNWILPGVVFS